MLNDLVSPLVAEADQERRYRAVAAAYTAAAAEWPPVVTITGSPLSAADWIDVLAAGLGRYGTGEGW